MKNKIQIPHYRTVTVPISNRKIVDRGKIDTPNTQIHDRSLSWLGTGTSQEKVAGLQCNYDQIKNIKL